MGASRDASPRDREDDAQDLLAPPSSYTTVTRLVNITDPYPTIYVQTDASSFKQVVQMFTGLSKKPSPNPNPTLHSIPPIKAVSNKKQSSSSRLYERRNSMKQFLKTNPTYSGLPQIRSPSILHIPSLALDPVTPLMSDPFNRSGSSSQSPSDCRFGHYDPKPSSDAVAVDNSEQSAVPNSPSLFDDFDSLATSLPHEP